MKDHHSAARMEDVQERQMVTIQVREAVLCIVGFLKGEGNPPEKISSGRFWQQSLGSNHHTKCGLKSRRMWISSSRTGFHQRKSGGDIPSNVFNR